MSAVAGSLPALTVVIVAVARPVVWVMVWAVVWTILEFVWGEERWARVATPAQGPPGYLSTSIFNRPDGPLRLSRASSCRLTGDLEEVEAWLMN